MTEIALARQAMDQTIRQSRSAHPGLLLRRGLTALDTDTKQNGPAKSALIQKICQLPAPGIYQMALERWKRATADAQRFSRLHVRFEQRLFIGLSAETAMETGIQTHHTWGMPMIPGSSLKGCARAHATAIGVPDDYVAAIFGNDEPAKPTASSGAETISSPGAGCLVWHDAWWVPGDNDKPFVAEVVTVHHPEYYAGKGEATDFDSPVPNSQIATSGTFYIVIEGDPAWAKLAGTLLQRALQEVGIGAKRAAGYGYAGIDEAMEKRVTEQLRDAQLVAEQAALAKLSPADREIRRLTALLNDQIKQQGTSNLTWLWPILDSAIKGAGDPSWTDEDRAFFAVWLSNKMSEHKDIRKANPWKSRKGTLDGWSRS